MQSALGLIFSYFSLVRSSARYWICMSMSHPLDCVTFVQDLAEQWRALDPLELITIFQFSTTPGEFDYYEILFAWCVRMCTDGRRAFESEHVLHTSGECIIAERALAGSRAQGGIGAESERGANLSQSVTAPEPVTTQTFPFRLSGNEHHTLPRTFFFIPFAFKTNLAKDIRFLC